MAKFCSNCGAPIDDNIKVCGNCGKPNPHYKNSSLGVNIPNLNIPAGTAELVKKYIPFAAIAIVAIIFIAIAANVVFSHTGYKGTVRKFVTAVQKKDGDAAVKLFSESFKDGSDRKDKDFADSLENVFKSRIERYEDRVGKNVRFKVIEFDIDVMDKDDFEDAIDSLEDSGYDVDNIRKIAEVEATVRAKGKKKDREYDWDFLMVKEKGSWKIWSYSMDY